MRKCLFLLLVFAMTLPLWPQEDPSSYIGRTLDELIRLFGPPRSVHPVRGMEEWQDDVIFVYNEVEFYIYRDRVWQAGLKAARGFKEGDTLEKVSATLGSKAQRRGDSLFLSIDEASCPMMLRCDFDKDGRLKVLFIYRTDL